MATLAVVGLLVAASPAGAIVITGGPSTAPGGGWTCTAPAAGSEKLAGGGSYSCTGTAGAFTNLYLGVNRLATLPFGDKKNAGAEPSGNEMFIWSADGATFIRYTGQSSMVGFGLVDTRVTLTFSGTGVVVTDATTQTLTGANIRGSSGPNTAPGVHSLWRIGSAINSMTVNVLIEASDAGAGAWQPADAYFGTIATHRPGTGSTEIDRSHVDLAFYTSSCGDSIVDGAETCDLGGSNGLTTSCCTGTCQFRAGGLTCRTSAGVCDPQETCTGSIATCPADSKSTAVCRPSATVCDAAESCDGVSNTCPTDAPASTSVVCRPSGGVCDDTENCDGVSFACPADGKSTAVCRPASGSCDVADSCDGVDDACPADEVEPTTVECRPSAGSCDIAESCDGANPACPADAVLPSSTECRASAGVCDVAENCTGSSGVCPGDGFAPGTQECRAAADVCDVAENCTGASANCPADAVAPASQECRASADVCDVAENCDGSSVACPSDSFAPSTQECRPNAGVCDAPENCTGSGAACPSDAFAPSTTECRATAGDCDVAESCTGSGALCPADAVKASTEECRADAGNCDVAENCDGSSVDCPADDSEPDGTSCSDANTCTVDDVCVAGTCAGDSMLCGDGIVQGGCGEQCDDGGTSPGDGCSPTCQVEPGLGCGAGPLPGCRQPVLSGKASLQLTSKTPNTKNRLKWKWLKGAATTTADFGNPVTSTHYQICVYDQSGLRFDAHVPPAGVCHAKACWKATGTTGFKYGDKDLTPDGISQLSLKAGVAGKAKIQVQGRGPLLGMPTDLSTLTQPVTVQISAGTGVCWEATYSTPPTAQSAAQFKDKAD